MWAPVLTFSSRIISYPCFPPLSRRDSTKRSRKLFTILSLTALVILSQGNYRDSILSSFNTSTPLKRLSRPRSHTTKLSHETAFQGLQCTECHSSYSKDEILQKCSKCNGLLDTIINPEILSEISKDDLDHSQSMWRYKAFLPVDEEDRIVTAGEGDTPLRRLSSFQ